MGIRVVVQPFRGSGLSKRPLFKGSLFKGIGKLGGICALLSVLPLTAAPLLDPPSAFAHPGHLEDNAVLRWNNAALQAIRDVKPAPTVVARSLAVVHTCIYDAWAAYDPVAVGTRLGGTLRRPAAEATEANKTKAVSYAAYRALTDLFRGAAQKAEFDAVMQTLGYDATIVSTDVTTPEGIGNTACQAVLDFRHQDGSNQLGDLAPGAYADYTGYTPKNTVDRVLSPNRWQPLSVPDGHGGFSVQKFATPQFGQVTPFALRSGSELRTKRPPRFFRKPQNARQRFERAEYISEARHILKVSANLTDRQKVIAEYWADGPASELPPGHWNLIAQFVSRRDDHTIDDDAKLFFAVGNAVMDAGIAAWDEKRAFDYVRPVTAIRFLYRGRMVRAWGGPLQGTKLIRGETWQPYQAPNVVTPPFAECVSGHSTFSAAAAEVLKRYTGSDKFEGSATFAAGSSIFETGAVPATEVTLAWPTFTAAAEQAGLSRLYGGIHFQNGNLQGKAIGRKVGAKVWSKALSYFNGTAKE